MEHAMPRAIHTISQQGLRLGDAMRKYGPPEVVGRLDALLDEREITQNWETLRRNPRNVGGMSPMADLERQVETVLLSLWVNLQARLTAGEVILTWQPSDPTAERRCLAADRCSRLQARMTSAGIEDRLILAGHVLDDVRIYPAQTEPLPAVTEMGGANEATTHASVLPESDPEFIDLRGEPPRLPRYKSKDAGSPFKQADLGQLDACIKKLAELDGGQTNRNVIRRWGRHWLRTVKEVDTTQGTLEKRFNDSEHKDRRRPDGGDHPRNARLTRGFLLMHAQHRD
jgi:hypothetical protein